MRESVKPTGKLSGHVYRADTGKPLGEVLVTLQDAGCCPSDLVANDESVRTDADGSYAFFNIRPGAYKVAAYRAGFVGRYYGMDRPDSRISQVIISPGQVLGRIDLSLKPEPDITMMADDAIATAYPEQRRELDFFGARFSPDGEVLALILSNITTGGPEQVWLYEFRSRRLIPVTERLQGSMRFRDLAWAEDGILYVEADRNGSMFYVAATMTTVKKIDRPPTEIAALFEQRAHLNSREERTAQYVVAALNQGHGSLDLTWRLVNSNESKQIATGSWELESFIFDSEHLRVLYPKSGGYGAIVTFDLRTGQSRDLAFQVGESLRLLDRRRDGTLIAYTVSGPCQADDSRDQWILNAAIRAQSRSPRNVCFVAPN